jgi:superfamily II DNA or RNA helicase
VTQYVREEMGKAAQLTGPRKGSVGFALAALQRRLASSPEAIYQSLKGRRERLEKRLREETIGASGRQALSQSIVASLPEDEDDLTGEEQERLEEEIVDEATAAQTIVDLETEIEILADLEDLARKLVASGKDRKWEQLSQILQNDPKLRDADGRLRKLIIFTEHRATLNYLQQRIGTVLGKPESVVSIHGMTPRDERRKLQALFRSEPDTRVLVATDAAGEGVNLQNANLMVNYDLPWNPNRLEQRFGRIHRIGQQEVCHLWNLVAKETREGDVYHRLLKKLEVESEALKGRVFNILGDVFEETSLQDLLIEAIRYGDDPEVRGRLSKKIDAALDETHLKSILERHSLAAETMDAERLFRVKEEMEKAEARRLQPYFVRSYFMKAFADVGGSIYPREKDRWQISHVPSQLRERDRLITGRNRRDQSPVLRRYERVCFTKEAVRPLDQPGLQPGIMLHPGHPLMLAVSDEILEKHANLLRQGALFVDPTDDGEEPSLLFLITHEVRSGDGTVLSKRLQFVRVAPDGAAAFAGWAPHLDLEPIADVERSLLEGVLEQPWLQDGLEQRALAYAASNLVPQHYGEGTAPRFECHGTAFGASNRRIGRAGCAPGDTVISVGSCGRFASAYVKARTIGYAGLKESERDVLSYPKPLVREMQTFASRGYFSAASDCSDGVLGSLWNIAQRSNCGFELSLSSSSLPAYVREAAELAGFEPFNLAMFWGDWQVIATVPAQHLEMFLDDACRASVEAIILGVAVVGEPRLTARDERGRVRDVRLLRNENFRSTSFNASSLGNVDYMLRTPLFVD